MDRPWWSWGDLLTQLGLVLRKKPAKPKLLEKRRLALESLEPRKLMSVTPSFQAVVDHNNTSAFAEAVTSGAAWTRNDPNYGGHQDSHAAASSSTATATWSFTALNPGDVYQVYGMWASGGTTAASQAPFTIFDGSQSLQTVDCNERSAPRSDGVVGSQPWQSLGYYRINTGVLSVQLSNLNAGGYVLANAIGIVDVSMPVVSMTPSVQYTKFGDTGVQVAFTRTGPTNAALTVNFSIVSATPSDFDLEAGSIGQLSWVAGHTTGSVTIPAGSSQATVTIEAAHAPSNPSGETFDLQLSAAGTGGSQYNVSPIRSSAAVTLLTQTDPPLVGVTPTVHWYGDPGYGGSDPGYGGSSDSGYGGYVYDSGYGGLTITRIGQTDGPLTVDFSVSDTVPSAFAVLGANSWSVDSLYSGTGTVTIPAGASQTTLTISAIGQQSQGEVAFSLLGDSGYNIVSEDSAVAFAVAPIGNSAATFTPITGSVSWPTTSDGPLVEITPQTQSTGYDLPAANVTITRTGSTDASLTVYLSLGGSASSGDYQMELVGSGTVTWESPYSFDSVTIPAGASQATITLGSLGTFTSNEEVDIWLTSNGSGYVVDQSNDGATVTLQANDEGTTTTAGTPTVKVTPATQQATYGSPAQVTIQRTGATNQPLTVDFSLETSATDFQLGMAGGDGGSLNWYFGASTGSVTIAAGSNQATVTIAATDTPSSNEEVDFALLPDGSDASNPAYLNSSTDNQTAAVILTSEPTVASVEVGITPQSQSMAYGSSAATVTFTRSGPTDQPLVVNYDLGGSASSGDYQIGLDESGSVVWSAPNWNGSLTIPSGASQAALMVEPNSALASNEEVDISLESAGSDYEVDGNNMTAAVTLLAGGGSGPSFVPGPPLVAVTPAMQWTAYGAPGVGVTIGRVGPTDQPLTVLYYLNGTATSSEYHISLSNTENGTGCSLTSWAGGGLVTIPAGAVQATVTITADQLLSSGETVDFNVAQGGTSSASVYDVAGGYATATVDIGSNPNGAAANITLGSLPSTIAQGADLTLTAMLSGAIPDAPTGKVAFYDQSTLLGAVSLAGGIAALDVTTLSPGTHHIKAMYLGDANFQPTSSASPAYFNNVNVLPLVPPVLTTSADEIAYSTGSATITASMPANATGSICFYVDGVAQGSGVALQTSSPALQFSGTGSSSYVEVADPVGLPIGNAARTISTWFKLASASSGLKELIGYGASGNGQLFGIAAGSVAGSGMIEVSADGSAVSSNKSTVNARWLSPDTNWHELTVVVPDGGALGSTVVYLDGNRLSTSVSGSGSTFNTVAGPLDLGGGATGWAQQLSGSLAETMIFDRALSSTEASALVQNPAAFYQDPALAAAYQPLEKNGSTISDFTGNGNDAALPASGVTWTSSGSSTPTVATAIFNYSAAGAASGQHTIKAVYSGSGSYATGTSAELVEDVVAAPTVLVIDDGSGSSVGTYMSGSAGSPVDLSVDSPSDADTYTWSVSYNGGTSSYASGQGADFTFTPVYSGNYQVTLTDSNAAGSSSVGMTLSASGPSAASLSIDGLPSSVTEGEPLSFSADITNPATAYSYLWTITPTSPSASSITGTQSWIGYTPLLAGSFTVSLTATDAYGNQLTAGSGPITVSPVAPTAIFNVANPVGATVNVSLTNGYHPSSTEMAGLKYGFVLVSHGSTEPTFAYGSASSSTSATLSITTSGVYDVWGAVIDQEGQETTYETTIDVSNLAPASSSLSPSSSDTVGSYPLGTGSLSGGNVQYPVISNVSVTTPVTSSPQLAYPINDQAYANSTPPPISVLTICADGATTATFSINAGTDSSLAYSCTIVPLSDGATAPSVLPRWYYPDKWDATFTHAGDYRVTVSASDYGLTTTGVFDVTVAQTLTSISDGSTTSPIQVAAGDIDAFTAKDQFGNDMASDPASIAWSASGAGTIDNYGVYTAPVAASSASGTVSASYNGHSASQSMSVAADLGPSVAVPASGTMDSGGKSVLLSVLGSDVAGESNLTYTWSVASAPVGYNPSSFTFLPPSGQSYSNGTNSASLIDASGSGFAASGTYVFSCQIYNTLTHQSSDASVSVDVTPVLGKITITSPAGGFTAGGSSASYSASALDQFNQPMSQQPTFQWDATAGQIDSSGNFTPPNVSEPCQVSVSVSGGAYFSVPVNIGNAQSPETAYRVGQGWIEPLFEQALGSPSAAAARVADLKFTSGWSGADLVSLLGWTPGTSSYGGTQPSSTGCSTGFSSSTSSWSWTSSGTSYTATETDRTTYSWNAFVASGGASNGWSYYETRTSSYAITIIGGASPTTASGSLGYTLVSNGGNYSPTYVLSVIATATASGASAGCAWTQTTTNTDNYNSSSTVRRGSGGTTQSYTYTHPYSGGSSSQPINGTENQAATDTISYSYDTFTGAGAVESSGSYGTWYSGGGRGNTSGTTWNESEHGGDWSSYDVTNAFAYGGGTWTMNSAGFSTSGSGNSYQSQSATSPYSPSSSVSIPIGGASASGSASPLSFGQAAFSSSMSGSATESSMDESSYTIQEHATWSAASNWGPLTGSQTTNGDGSTNFQFNVGGNYSYNLTLNGNASGSASPAGSGWGGGDVGGVSGTFQQSGNSGTNYNYATAGTLSSAGWSTTGWQTTGANNSNSQSSSGSGTFSVPKDAQGWMYIGAIVESAGQTSNDSQSARFSLDASGNWQQTSGTESGNSDVSQSARQWGSYSHMVNGVTLAGAFSQSASADDNASFSIGGSSSAGQWLPNGSKSETVTTSSNFSFSGSGHATATLAAVSSSAWVSSGTQSESHSGNSYASQTTHYSMSSDGSWQATSGSGSTNGGETTFAGYSGSGHYASYAGDYSGGSVAGTFTQQQSNTVSYQYNTTDTYTSASGSGASYTPGYWSATSGSGSTTDSGGSSFTYSGTGQYGGTYGSGGPHGTMTQSGGGSESFGYTKYYTIASGNWVVGGSLGSGSGGASGNGFTYSSYDGAMPYTTNLPSFVSDAAGDSALSAVSGTDHQSGRNYTSYSFQTYAKYNGLDWSETGLKTSSGSGSTSDSFSASNPASAADSSLSFGYPTSTGVFSSGYGKITNGWASATGTLTTAYSYTAQAFLDDDGVWQNKGSSNSSGNWFATSGTTYWSVFGNAPYNPTLYGNSTLGYASCTGSGSDSYSYTQYFTISRLGEWQAVSGSGSASGGGSVTFNFVANGGYSQVDPNWPSCNGGTAGVATWLGSSTSTNGHFSGQTSASGVAYRSSAYSMNSTYTSSAGWVASGSAWATASGQLHSSFSASSPFTIDLTAHASYDPSDILQSGSVTGIASGSGSDWASYSYTERQDLTNGVWQPASGSGWASGGSSADWSYRGGQVPHFVSGTGSGSGSWAWSGFSSGPTSTTTGSYTQFQDSYPPIGGVVHGGGGSVNGKLGGSGEETYSLHYSASASLPSGQTDWVWTSGNGSAVATSTYDYYYAGSGGGSISNSAYLPTFWGIDSASATVTIPGATSGGFGAGYGEWGSGSGTATYRDDSLTLVPNGSSYAWSGSPTYSVNTAQEDYYNYWCNDHWGLDEGPSSTSITEDEITHTSGSGSWPWPSLTSHYSGGGVATTAHYSSDGTAVDWANGSWTPTPGDDTQVTVTGHCCRWEYPLVSTTSETPDGEFWNGDDWDLPPYPTYYGCSYLDVQPEPGRDGVLAHVVSPTKMTSGGVDLPGGTDGYGNPIIAALPATNNFVDLRVTPTIPAGAISDPGDGPTTQAAPASVLTNVPDWWGTVHNQVDSLVNLAPMPALVYRVFGMANTALVGGSDAYTGEVPLQTPFAEGNAAGVDPTSFTSETIRGADGVFSTDNVAAAYPVTHSLTAQTYGFAGVGGSQAYPAGGAYSTTTTPTPVAVTAEGANPSIDPLTNVVESASSAWAGGSSASAARSQASASLASTATPVQVPSVTDANGGVTRFAYNNSGQVNSLTDPVGNSTTWTYDSQGNVIQQTNANGSASFAYNSANALTSYTDADGNVRTYQYDSAGHVVTEILYATAADAAAGQNAEDTLHFAYDASGNLISESDNCSSDAYAYDGQNRLVTVSQTDEDAPTVVMTYQYSAGGTKPSGVAVAVGGVADYQDAYTYDSAGRLTSIARTSASGGNAVASETIDLSYNASGQVETIDRYQGGQLAVEADYTYDSAGRLTGLTYHQGTTVLAGYSYTYAASATGGATAAVASSSWLPGGAFLPATTTQGINTAAIDAALTPEQLVASVTSLSGSVQYSYDAQGQLTAATYSGGQTQPNESYFYDANGNRTSSSGSSPVVIGANNEVLFDGTYTYTYDADGNCTAKFIDVNHTGVLQSGDTSVTQYAWNAGGRLVQVTASAAYGSAPTQVVTYLYDAENRWIGENIANGSGVITHETRFVYDGSEIALQFDANSPLPSGEGQGEGFAMTAANLSHRYLWGPGVDQLLSDEQLSPLPPGEGQGEGSGGYNVSASGTVVWALTDNVGTVRDLAICDPTTSTTSVVNHLTYTSFGQLLSQTNPATGATATVVCVFGFTGRPYDSNTGLQNNLYRWYNPALGRWESIDPTGFTAEDTNEYRYVGDSPANAVDPSGLIGESDQRMWARMMKKRKWDGDLSWDESWSNFWQGTKDTGYVAWEGIKGVGQGALNILNGLQDTVIGAANLPAMGVNGIAWVEEKVGILDPNHPIRVPHIPSPDWSRDKITHEPGKPGSWFDSHSWSKFAGASGVEILAGTWAAKAAKAAKAAEEARAAEREAARLAKLLEEQAQAAKAEEAERLAKILDEEQKAARAVQEAAKKAAEEAAKKAAEEAAMTSPKYGRYVRRVDDYKHALDPNHVKAAQIEKTGGVVARDASGIPYDHLLETRNAMMGAKRRIVLLKKYLSDPGLSAQMRSAVESELAELSKMLDTAEQILSELAR